jgi:hypothetical protein
MITKYILAALAAIVLGISTSAWAGACPCKDEKCVGEKCEKCDKCHKEKKS